MHTPRYGFERERGLSPQTRRERQLQRIAFTPSHKLAFRPAQPLQLLPNQALGFGCGGRSAQLSRVLFA